MADRKKRKGKTETLSNKLTKDEDAIARFVRFNCPTNTTMFEGNEVHYFSAKKAVDLLMESKKYGVNAKTPKFATIESAEQFMSTLLEKGLFFRARKVVLKKKDKTTDNKDKKKEASNKSPKSKKQPKDDNASETNVESTELLPADEESSAETKLQEEEKKKKKKVKLIFHSVQVFDYDPADVYVWIFDPTPFLKKLIGLLIVLGTIAGCLFPLWPDWLRLVIYYLSVTGISFFGLLLGVALLRTILFGIIWACTLGRHKLWLLPNLTEDCGFFDSFKPFHTYEYVPGGIFSQESSKKKKKRSTMDSKDVKKAVKLSGHKTDSDAPSASSSVHNTPKMEREGNSVKEAGDGGESTGEKSDAEDEEVNIDDYQQQIPVGDKPDNSRNSESEEEIDATKGNSHEKDDEAEKDEVRRRNVARKEKSSTEDDFVIVDSGATA